MNNILVLILSQFLMIIYGTALGKCLKCQPTANCIVLSIIFMFVAFKNALFLDEQFFIATKIDNESSRNKLQYLSVICFLPYVVLMYFASSWWYLLIFFIILIFNFLSILCWYGWYMVENCKNKQKFDEQNEKK